MTNPPAMPASLAEYLNQGEVWMSKSGLFLIAQMTDMYKIRAMRWLTKNCGEIFRHYTLELDMSAETPPTLETRIKWIDTRPSNWIRTTPLFLALEKGTPEELNR